MKYQKLIIIASTAIAFTALAFINITANAQETNIRPPVFAISAAAAKKITAEAKGNDAWSPAGLISDYQEGDDKFYCALTITPGADVCGSMSSGENAQKAYIVLISNTVSSAVCEDLKMIVGIGGQRCASFYGKTGKLDDGTTPVVSNVKKYQIEPIEADGFPPPPTRETPLQHGAPANSR